jgi:hypothetical protein
MFVHAIRLINIHPEKKIEIRKRGFAEIDFLALNSKNIPTIKVMTAVGMCE